MFFPNLQPPTPNPHILITGASSGIGAALALEYAAPGVRLSLHGRSTERLKMVADVCEERGATVTTTIGDVADKDAMAAWIEECDRSQPLDLVIANAGVSGGTSGLTPQQGAIGIIFTANWRGVLHTIHPVIEVMAKRGRGQIALMSSLASFRGFAGSGAYCASKAAVRVYGESLRAELAPLGIKVNVICPGYIETPMTDVNRFPMPFLMKPARAAQIIRHGLGRDAPRVAFPRTMYALVRFAALLPQDFVNRMIQSWPRKPTIRESGVGDQGSNCNGLMK